MHLLVFMLEKRKELFMQIHFHFRQVMRIIFTSLLTLTQRQLV